MFDRKRVLKGFVVAAALLLGCYAFLGHSRAEFRVRASASGPSPSVTGAPGEANCTACHTDFLVNSGSGSISITGVPQTVSPGEEIPVTVTVSQEDGVIFGFQLTAIDENGAEAGTLSLPKQNPAQMQIVEGVVDTDVRHYVEHTSQGTQPSEFGTKSWTFNWTAPLNDPGPVTFYAAGNAANSDADTTGDYIYTTSQTTNETPGPPYFDFDGDGKTDVSVFRPNAGALSGGPGPEGSTAQWWLLRSSDQGTRGMAFGTSTDIPAAADFTGDGKTDVAFWRPSTGEWFILRSEDDSFFAFPFGANGDIPAPGDFDGDGKADPAVYRPSSGTWFIVRSTDGGLVIVPFGVTTDKPIVADYDGDGKDDVGVYRAPDNQFWLLRSTDGVKAFQFGAPGDRTAVGDWTGDGKADVAFFRPSTSEWYVIRSEDDSFFAFPWGANADIPSPGDFDGDGKFDPAVWRPSDRTWYIFGTTSGFEAVQFGSNGDVPLPSSVSVQ
ncbi:MAG: hypothetical protein IPM63_06945 [Acidobacteriota bacterium]|nr:MAG: hypothetical protein IPM63_06945 [Acidobacteriota bacterium]